MDSHASEAVMRSFSEDLNINAFQQSNPMGIGFDAKTKKSILWCCLLASCIGNMMLDAVYSFMPLFIKN